MSFNSKLINLLKTNPNFVDAEDELLLTAIQDHAWKLDHDLIKLLLNDGEIKAKFFDEIDGYWIFNLNTFIEYISQKNFLDNSYTRFRNRIGLTIANKYLSERGEVSLVWPYKDCVLEGGQTKEEEKRKEIFFNEVLAQDEINRLLDPKVLTNFVRFIQEGEEPVKEIKRDKKGLIRENLIIKGNNLLALHTLKTQFRGQVKLIYIDPPFNTEDDSFQYNDKFKHSAWLTFISNRLKVAHSLLTNNGVICIHIGNEEVAYLQVILDEIFGRENFLNHIVTTTNEPSGFKATSSKIFSTSNHLLIYGKGQDSSLNKLYVEKDYDSAYKYFLLNKNDHFSKWKYCSIKEALCSDLKMAIKDFEENFTEIQQVQLIANFANKNKDKVFRTAAISGGALAKRKITIEKSKSQKGIVVQHPNEDVEGFYILNGEQILFWQNNYRKINGKMVPTTSLTDVWTDIAWTGIAPEGQVILKNGKKPERLLQRIIDLVITSENDIVCDFFVGSGTTVSVAHKMRLQYIGVEQLDYGENDNVKRLQNVIAGEKSGISRDVNWQGGGDFICCELMKYNESFVNRIQDAKNSDELVVQIWKDMAEHSFLNWYVNPEMPEKAMSDFIEIGNEENGFEKQKRLLVELLDKNQLYVNLSEIDDECFAVSEEDKRLNKAFYQES